MNTPVFSSAKYQYAYTTFPAIGTAWTFVHDSSRTPLVTTAQNFRLYYAPRNELRLAANNTTASEVLWNDVASGYTLPNIINDDFKGTNYNNNFYQDEVIFESYELTSPMTWRGAPALKL